jgi:uncharacterized protein YraI
MPGRIIWHVAGLVAVMLLAAGCTLGIGGAVSEPPTPEISGAPVVSIVAPQPNTTYLTDVSINVLVRVSNAGPDIDRVDVAVDGTVIASLPDPNPSGAGDFSVIQTWIAASGQHTLSATAYRTEGSASQPASVIVNVVDELPSAATDTPTITPTPEVSATPEVVATNTPAVTNTVPPAAATSAQAEPTTAASTSPRVKALGFTNVRRGPSTNFIPPLGALNTDEEVDILALNTAGDWIKIRFRSGEGWVFRQIVEVVGDITNVPREAGPPIPTLPPATNTPPPAATAAPTTGGGVTGTDGPDLVITGFALFPVAGGTKDNIFVNEAVYVQVRVRNNGNRDSAGFFVVLEMFDKNENALSFPPVAVSVGGLGAGQETLVEMGYTDPDNPGRLQSAVVTVDRNNQVAETNESNNSYPPIEYTLGAR